MTEQTEREKLVEVIRETMWRQTFAPDEHPMVIERQKDNWPDDWERTLPTAKGVLLAIEAAGARVVPVEATEEMVSAYYDEMPTPYHIDMRDTGEARQAIEHVLAASPYAPQKDESK